VENYITLAFLKVMDDVDLQPLMAAYHRILDSVSLTFKRYLYGEINWNVRMSKMPFTSLWITFDSKLTPSPIWWNIFILTGGTSFSRWIHKFPDWSLVLKNLYDSFHELSIVYTGSSMLDIDDSKTDLSRRQTHYTLNGLSFREYLEYEGAADTKPLDFAELPSKHVEYAMDLVGKVKVLKYFDQYLQTGYIC